jgi:hypothetical protein
MPLHFANVAPCEKCLDMSEDSSAAQILGNFNKSRFWNVQENDNSSKFQDKGEVPPTACVRPGSYFPVTFLLINFSVNGVSGNEK